MIDLGYRKIAHITNSAHVSITIARLNGYIKALEESDILIEDKYIKYCVHGGRDIAELKVYQMNYLIQKNGLTLFLLHQIGSPLLHLSFYMILISKYLKM